MNIQEYVSKIKSFRPEGFRHELFIILSIILASTASFGLGRLSAFESRKTAISIDNVGLNLATPIGASSSGEKGTKVTGVYVASKNGSKYHLPTCPGAKTIAEANKIWFETREEAEQAGYTGASNCNSLK